MLKFTISKAELDRLDAERNRLMSLIAKLEEEVTSLK
jgi:hypothetical protein